MRNWSLFRSLHRREEGQAAIEFLLVLPFFLLFLFLAISFGMLMYQYVSVANAVREGARYAAVNCSGDSEEGGCTTALVQRRVWERSGGVLDSGDAPDIHVVWEEGSHPARGSSVTVRVCYETDLLFFKGPKFPRFTIKSTADMRLEQQDKGTGLSTSGACS